MPIHEVPSYQPVCDRCGRDEWDHKYSIWSDHHEAIEAVTNSDGIVITGGEGVPEVVLCVDCATPDDREQEALGGYYGDAEEYAEAWADFRICYGARSRQAPKPLGWDHWHPKEER